MPEQEEWKLFKAHCSPPTDGSWDDGKTFKTLKLWLETYRNFEV